MNGIALLLDTFRQEATELLDELAKILDAQRAGQGDAAALISARRVAHNLKGAALSVGARRISEACHLLEDELEATTRAEAPASAEQLEAWLRIQPE